MTENMPDPLKELRVVKLLVQLFFLAAVLNATSFSQCEEMLLPAVNSPV